MHPSNDNHREHIIVEELPDGREVAVRAPLPAELQPMTGPARGDYEEWVLRADGHFYARCVVGRRRAA